MPVTRHELTGELTSIIGPLRSPRAVLRNVQGEWLNTTDKKTALGNAEITLTSDAKIAGLTLPDTSDTGLQYEVVVAYQDPLTRAEALWFSGVFSMDAPADLADKAQASSTGITPTLGEALAARIDGVLDHGDVSGTVEIDPAIGMHEMDATGATTLVLLDPPGKVLNLIVYTGADQVIVDGLPDLTLADAAVASLYYGRNGWTVAAAGAAAATDTTPPSAPTGLTATGGAGELTFSFTPGSDPDSAVTHRYEVYTGASSGTSSLVTANPMTVTGLTAGTYTVRVFARSAGGNSTVVTTTATVTAPAGWSVLASDDFTGTDGTVVKGRATPVGGIVWDGDTAPIISGNKVVWQAPTMDAGVVLPLAAAASAVGVEVSFDCAVAPQVDTSLPYVEFIFPNSPIVRFDCTGAGAGQVSVRGYNSSNVSGQTLAGPVATSATANIAARRVGDLIQVLVNGAVAIEHNLAGGYLGYVGAATPNTVTIIGYAFKTSSLDNFQARVLS